MHLIQNGHILILLIIMINLKLGNIFYEKIFDMTEEIETLQELNKLLVIFNPNIMYQPRKLDRTI